MSDHLPQRGALLTQFEQHLAKASYVSKVVERYRSVVDQFLEYLGKRHVLIDAVQPCHVTMFVRCELRRFARRHGHGPASIDRWRRLHTCAVHRLLRLTMGQWPPIVPARSPYEAFSQALCAEYAAWLDERLDAGGRQRVREARRHAVSSLLEDLASEGTGSARLGLPDAATAREMLASMRVALETGELEARVAQAA